MAFAKTPTKGMRDFLPSEYRNRQQAMRVIQDTYASYGFGRIETPCVENINLLCSKQGGDNEKLIFRILKRGDKLENASEGNICDLGLRYDLTVPLARYYANNCGNLPSVFKAMQMDNVWRADRPQKGRFRQFVQCDIDIIGEASALAEVELITATAEALHNLGLSGSTIRVSDRRLLTALANKCNFPAELHSQLFISLDKLDKLGVTGVLDEINTYAPDKALDFVNMINRINGQSDPLAYCIAELGDYLDSSVATNLTNIIAITNGNMLSGKVVFDVTLVRGMGYYTGTIYEITLDGLGISAGGGGRYDKMIGKITGTDVPACGFSIGFERICMLLEGKQSSSRELTALIVPKDSTASDISNIMVTARQLRKGGDVTMVKRIKNFAFQLKQLSDMGCTTIYEYRQGTLVKIDK